MINLQSQLILNELADMEIAKEELFKLLILKQKGYKVDENKIDELYSKCIIILPV